MLCRRICGVPEKIFRTLNFYYKIRISIICSKLKEIFRNDMSINGRFNDNRIIGGSTAPMSSHKWLVHLEGVRCGGVIIGNFQFKLR